MQKLKKVLNRIGTRNTEKRRAKRGPTELSIEEKRRHCVSVRLNDSELSLLDRTRVLMRSGRIRRGEFLRIAALDLLPPTIPSINQKAWDELSHAAGNLATIANAMRNGKYVEADELREMVAAFRKKLIGAGA